MQSNTGIVVRFIQKTVHAAWVYQELIPALLDGSPEGIHIISPHDGGNHDGCICVVHSVIAFTRLPRGRYPILPGRNGCLPQ